MHHAASGTMGSVLPLAAFAPRQKWIVTLSVCFLRTRPFSLQVQRMSANRPLWQNLTCNFEVFGSFLGSFYTGEMHTPLDSKQVLLFALEIWFLLLFLVK
jgi:hypothetical protein